MWVTFTDDGMIYTWSQQVTGGATTGRPNCSSRAAPEVRAAPSGGPTATAEASATGTPEASATATAEASAGSPAAPPSALALTWNPDVRALQDPRVRQAISLASDLPVHWTPDDASQSANGLGFNPEEAAKLLEAAGYYASLSLTLGATRDDPELWSAAERLRASLEAAFPGAAISLTDSRQCTLAGTAPSACHLRVDAAPSPAPPSTPEPLACEFSIAFNTAVAPFDDPAFRDALLHAIDSAAIAEYMPEVVSWPIQATIHQSDLVFQDAAPFDPVAAREFLARSPYASTASDLEPVLTIVSSEAYFTAVQVLQEGWRNDLAVDVGILVVAMTASETPDALLLIVC